MRRRQFITLFGGTMAAWPLAARAQQGERVRRIGVLVGVADDAETKGWVATFRKRLDELGWRAGDNLQIEERWTEGDPDRNRRFAGELLAVKPDAIFAFSSVAVAALQRESGAVPIVFTAISDPVGSGFVESLARPGGNATGFTNFVPTMAAKWLEVLKEIAPQVQRAVLLFNPQTAPYVAQYYQRPFEAAATSFGVQASIWAKRFHARPNISIVSSRAQNRPIFPYKRPPNSSWRSIFGLPKRSASPCRPRYSPAPTR